MIIVPTFNKFKSFFVLWKFFKNTPVIGRFLRSLNKSCDFYNLYKTNLDWRKFSSKRTFVDEKFHQRTWACKTQVALLVYSCRRHRCLFEKFAYLEIWKKSLIKITQKSKPSFIITTIYRNKTCTVSQAREVEENTSNQIYIYPKSR